MPFSYFFGGGGGINSLIFNEDSLYSVSTNCEISRFIVRVFNVIIDTFSYKRSYKESFIPNYLFCLKTRSYHSQLDFSRRHNLLLTGTLFQELNIVVQEENSKLHKFQILLTKLVTVIVVMMTIVMTTCWCVVNTKYKIKDKG